jgi:hypothetical protein
MKQGFHFCTENLAFMYPRTASVVLRSSSTNTFLELEKGVINIRTLPLVLN